MIQILLPLKVFDLIGYAKTASSPNEAFNSQIFIRQRQELLSIGIGYYLNQRNY